MKYQCFWGKGITLMLSDFEMGQSPELIKKLARAALRGIDIELVGEPRQCGGPASHIFWIEVKPKS